jgi:hypothetical protein
MTHIIKVLILSSIIVSAEQSNPSNTDSNKIDYLRLGVFCGLSASVLAYSHLTQSSYHWSTSTSFYTNFADDWQYAHGADKFGHAFASNLISNVVSEGLMWSHVDTATALWCGFGAAIINQTLVEIRDGFSKGRDDTFTPYLGFSWGDMASNIFGASYPLLQHNIPFLRDTRLKYSLNPSHKIQQGGFYSSILDDYESEYHWLSVNIYDALPASAKKYWTPYINIAIGHSVKNIVDSPSHYTYAGNHELWLSLDYNIEALPGDTPLLQFLKKVLNVYKLPAPCVRILPSVTWYGIRL